eukprot:TRINITY_DN40353_c0_g1_i1.p1 TRINITY_DN40353_c0_g1~~TRINITY_DN40353_c0_g1_i1.p1  ORF type:complete len:534 (+),score=53.68 TRINITY_DN40353_c0_g1_i1:75-1676(+)
MALPFPRQHAKESIAIPFPMPATPRTKHPPLSARQTFRVGDGANALKAFQDRTNQDLLYRGEYLAGLVSERADLQDTPSVPPGQHLRDALTTSTAPQLIAASNQILTARHPQDLSFACKPPRNSMVERWLQKGEFKAHSATAFQLAWSQERFPKGPEELENPCLYKQASNHRGSSVNELNSLSAWEDTCRGVSSMLLSHPNVPREACESNSEHRIMTLKVKPVPAVHEQLPRDHTSSQEHEKSRFLSSFRKVLCLSEEGVGDTQMAELNFARHFCQLKLNARTAATPKATASSFVRIDGLDRTSAQKFFLTDGNKVMRNEGANPFTSRALITAPDPAQVFQAGHYFEVKVVNVSKASFRSDRPRLPGTSGRTEGLTLGFTSQRPGEVDRMAKDVASVSNSWCISCNGTYYHRPGSIVASPKRPANQMRAVTPIQKPWHQRSTPASEQLTCSWPAPHHREGMIIKNFDWHVSLVEGDTVGLLVLPFGGLALTVNGVREIVVADAGLPTDVDLFPLVEVYNHLRVIQLLPSVDPP